jgi:FSR family fosmidomycin resistance protein-like MFS transporter
MQPLFGLWSDRHGALWLLPAGLALGGVGIGLAAVAPSYGLLLVLVFVSGIGIAAYHPEGAKFAVFLSGRKRASGMSLFNIGGNLGYALGPIVVTPLVLWLGLGPGGLLASIPVILTSIAVLAALPYLARRRPTRQAGARRALGEDNVRAMVILTGVIGLRSVAWFGLLTFVPLWIASLGNSAADGNRVLSLMLLAGAVGTLLLGPLADRFGLRRTLLVAQALLAPMILVFVLVGGVVGTICLMVVGICVVGTFGVTMVLSQMYLPRHVGVASGLAVGLSMGLGGIAAVALGAVADAVDLETALILSALAPLLGVVLCFFLPAPNRPTAVATAPASPYPLSTDALLD